MDSDKVVRYEGDGGFVLPALSFNQLLEEKVCGSGLRVSAKTCPEITPFVKGYAVRCFFPLPPGSLYRHGVRLWCRIMSRRRRLMPRCCRAMVPGSNFHSLFPQLSRPRSGQVVLSRWWLVAAPPTEESWFCLFPLALASSWAPHCWQNFVLQFLVGS